MKKLYENTNQLKPEVEIDQIESTEAEPLTVDIVDDIGDLADDIYESIFETGSANIPEEAVTKIKGAHEQLLDAYEILEESSSSKNPEADYVTEQVSAENEDEKLDERKVLERMRNLALLGMIDRTAVNPVTKLIKDMHRGASLTANQRKLALTLLNGLIDIVTGDIVFGAARREIKKQNKDKSTE